MEASVVQSRDLIYEDGGAGFPIVFLHGLPFNRGTWQLSCLQLAGRLPRARRSRHLRDLVGQPEYLAGIGPEGEHDMHHVPASPAIAHCSQSRDRGTMAVIQDGEIPQQEDQRMAPCLGPGRGPMRQRSGRMTRMGGVEEVVAAFAQIWTP